MQVRAYSVVFWERYKELNDYERIIKNIERGEQRIQRQADIMAAIAAKLDRYRNPWQVGGCWLVLDTALRARMSCSFCHRLLCLQPAHATQQVFP